jgi:hypothetical protein
MNSILILVKATATMPVSATLNGPPETDKKPNDVTDRRNGPRHRCHNRLTID